MPAYRRTGIGRPGAPAAGPHRCVGCGWSTGHPVDHPHHLCM